MSTLPHRWLLSSIIGLFVLLPFTSFAQVKIKEKVEIKPQQESRPVKLAGAPVLRVIASFDGMVNDTFPALVYINGPCNIRAGVPGASGALTVPAYEGIYEAGYHFTSVSGGQFDFTVLLGDSVLVDVHESLAAHVTALSQHYLEMYTGIAFSVQYAAIWTKTENFFGASIVTGTEPCSEAHWSPLMTVEVEITRGSDIGELIDVGGIPVGSKITKRLSDLSNLTFVADGPKGYGDVEITARSGDIVITQTFPVKVHPPTVQIDPPYESYWPIVVDFAHLPILKFYEYHSPQPGEQYEPTISWFPADTIDTKNYIDTFGDTLHLFVKVMAENPGGVAVDSSEVILVKACIKVSFDRPTLSPGDTAGLSYQRVLPDGSPEDISPGNHLFSATILAGEDSSKGLLLGDYGAGTTLIDQSGIRYIAPKTFAGDTLQVFVTGSAIESGGAATSIRVPTKPWPATERIGSLQAKKGVSKPAALNSLVEKRKPGPVQLTDEMRKAAALSSSCPMSNVMVLKPILKIVDHAPWTIWPFLPSEHGGRSRGANRPGYNPKRGFKIQVTNASNEPMKNVQVKVGTEFVEGSAGHQHDLGMKALPLTKQGTFWPSSFPHNPVILATNEDGIVTIDSLVALQVSGKYLVSVSLLTDATVKDTVNLEVKVPGLVNLKNYQDATFGCNQTPTGDSNHPINNWCTPEMLDTLRMAILDFYYLTASQSGGGNAVKTSVNDLSLIWGGDFDVGADWDFDAEIPTHSLHRVGLSVDINRNKMSPDVMGELEKAMTSRHTFKRILERKSIHYELKGGN